MKRMTRDEARQERHARYRDDMAQYAISCQGTAWRECPGCKRNTRHSSGRCVECGGRDGR